MANRPVYYQFNNITAVLIARHTMYSVGYYSQVEVFEGVKNNREHNLKACNLSLHILHNTVNNVLRSPVQSINFFELNVSTNYLDQK